MTGLLGLSSGYRAMMDCDTLLMLGTDFPYQQFYPEKATIIQVDIRGEQIGRRTKVDLGVVGDDRREICSSTVCRKSNQRTCREGRDLHLRRSHAHDLGSALPCDERGSGQLAEPKCLCHPCLLCTRTHSSTRQLT
jgi:pyruvate dehydrogenase (quinone)